MTVAITFDPMSESDLDWVAVNEQDLHAFPWTRGNFADSMAAGYVCRVMRLKGAPIAYAVMLVALDEAHLLNLSVKRAMHGQGAGRALLAHLFDQARDYGAVQLFLEVRPSNAAALALYQRAGFAPIGRRRRYYPAADGQREDAVVMRVSL